MAWSGYSEKGTGSQERGPGGFSVDVPGVVQSPEGVDFQPVRAGGNMQSNGSITVGGQVDADETFGELYKLLQPEAQRRAKEVQDKKFMEGMSRAASGVAMQEIVAEQGAFSRLFGVAPAIEGARAYTVAARKSEWTADQTNRMSDLAKIDPGALPDVIQTSIAGQLTGDPETDDALRRELLTATPDLIRQHTKARYLHLQGEAKAARRTAIAGAMKEYSAVWNASPELQTQDQMDKAEQQLLNVWTPPPGVDEDSHMDDITDMLVDSLEQGNFDATRLGYDAGMVSQLGPDRISKVRAAATRNAPKALKKAITNPEIINRVVGLTTKPPTDVAAYTAEWNSINDLASGLTRVPREYGQLLDESNLLRGVGDAVSQNERRLTAEQKKAAEVVKGGVLGAIIQRAMASPDADGGLALSSLASKNSGIKITAAEEDAALGAAILATGDPKMQAAVMNKFGGNKISVGADLARNLWDSTNRDGAKWETHGAGFEKMLELYTSLNEDIKPKYFNDNQRAQLDAIDDKYLALRGLPPEQRARDLQALYETRVSIQRADTSKLSAEAAKGSAQAAVQKMLQSDMTTSIFSIDSPMGVDTKINTNVGERELSAATAIVMGFMADQKGPAGADKKAERAKRLALDRGVIDVQGGRMIVNEAPDEALGYTLAKHTGLPADTSAMFLEELISSRIKARKGDDNTRFVVRARGLPPRYVVYFEADGKDVIEMVTGDEVKAAASAPPKKVNPADTWEAGRLRQKP